MNMAAPTIDYYTQPRVFGHDFGDMHKNVAEENNLQNASQNDKQDEP
jgi:hypothetical protein